MPHYFYIALDGAGRRQRGRMEAANENGLGKALRQSGLWLAEAREVTVAPSAPRRARGNCRVPRRVLIQFFFSVALQLRAGVTAYNALAFGLEHRTHRGFRAVHADLLEQMRAGGMLSTAMEAHPRTFPPVVRQLVRAGEASGRLSEVCEEIRSYYEWTDRLAADVRQAIVYPATLMGAVAVAVFIMFTFFLPRLTGVLRELSVPLPWVTRMVIGLSDWFNAHGALLSVGGVLLVVGGGLAFRCWPGFARAWDGLKLRVPGFGPVLAQICMARLVQNLASLYRAGIPLLQALRLCRPLVGNRVMETHLAQVEEGVRAGRPLHETMGRLSVFPSLVVQMTALGETTGSLDQALQSVADYYHDLIPRAVKLLFTYFEPAMIFSLLIVVGVIALAIFLPLATVLEMT